MSPRLDTTEPPTGRSAAGRVPPHDLQAEESLLGAMMLSAGAIADAAGSGHRVRLLQAGPRPRLRRRSTRSTPPASPPTPSPWPTSCAGPACSRPSAARRCSPRSCRPRRPPPTRRATPGIVEEYALLRRLIGVAGEIAELGYSVPEDVQKALDRAESLVYEVNERRVTDTHAAAVEPPLGEPRPHRAAARAGRRHHRHAHGLPRPRPPAVGPAAELARGRRCPTRHGQDLVRAGHARPRRPRRAGAEAGPLLLASR